MIPKTYLIGETRIVNAGLNAYLKDSGNEDFHDSIEQAIREGVSEQEIITSFYAKLCYKSLTVGQNANVTKIRDIKDNVEGIVKTKHGSVYEHVVFNFITTNCSRVFTHELVRHRVGTAFSQTSGRYVAIDKIDLVLPPDLESMKDTIREFMQGTAKFCKSLRDELIPPNADFATKKRITSAIRRIAPNGQTNEIGWSANIRALRHMIEMRTSEQAEWEIRVVFNEVVDLINSRCPGVLYGMVPCDTPGGLVEYRQLRI